MRTTGLQIYMAFDGVRMAIPYGTAENYQKAAALADKLTGYTGRARGETGDTFYLEKKNSLTLCLPCKGLWESNTILD